MKAVTYHADAVHATGRGAGDLYRKLYKRFREHVSDFGMSLVHLTLDGHEGWGDENHYFYGLDPVNVVYNREEVFCQFLETAPDDVYWFTEVDCTVYQMWPKLTTDCAMLYRNALPPMTPAWRMARPSALPFFKELRDAMRKEPSKDWHGDTEAFTKVWRLMGSPKESVVSFAGCSVEMRDYNDYVKHACRYSRFALRWDQKEALCSSL